jgi:hypothetical protein
MSLKWLLHLNRQKSFHIGIGPGNKEGFPGSSKPRDAASFVHCDSGGVLHIPVGKYSHVSAVLVMFLCRTNRALSCIYVCTIHVDTR